MKKDKIFFVCYVFKTMKGHTNFLNWAKDLEYTNNKLLQK